MNSIADSNPLAATASQDANSLLAKSVSWARQNLFNNWYSSIITVVLISLAVWFGFRGLRFVLFTANWEPVRTNLTLLMIGTFPRNEQWRIVAQLLLLATAAGLFWGATIGAAKQRAFRAGLEFSVEPIWRVIKRWWALLVFVMILVVPDDVWNLLRTILFGHFGLFNLFGLFSLFEADSSGGFAGLAKTWSPLLMVVAAIMIIFSLREIVRRVGKVLRNLSWILGYVLSVAAWQVVSGTSGSAWWWLAVLLAYLAIRPVGYLYDRYLSSLLPANTRRWLTPAWAGVIMVRLTYTILSLTIYDWNVWAGIRLYFVAAAVLIAAAYSLRLGLILAAIVATTVIAELAYIPLSFDGVGWDKWSGFHLNLVATAIAIVAAFPLGILLALGRRSKLPVIKWLSVTYIELIRGVPLISLLFVG